MVRNPKGYGLLTVGYRLDGNKRVRRAHRIAWELAFGPVPDGLFVLHRCDNPPCCNPAHLFLGVPADNTRDMLQKGREASGNRNGRRRLSESDIPEIRRLLAGGVALTSIGGRFGVSRMTIADIAYARTWKRIS